METSTQHISAKTIAASFLILASIFLVAGFRDLNAKNAEKASLAQNAEANILAAFHEKPAPARITPHYVTNIDYAPQEQAPSDLPQDGGDAAPKTVREQAGIQTALEEKEGRMKEELLSFEIGAAAAIAAEADTGRIVYQKEMHKRLPIASVTKIMTAAAALEHVEASESITVTKRAVMTEGDQGGLAVGETLAAKDLLSIMLIPSSNDAAIAIEDHLKIKGVDLVAAMNNKASDFGLRDTHFENPVGFDGNAHYSSAFDLMRIAIELRGVDAVWEPTRLASATLYSSDGTFTHEMINTNALLGTIGGIIGGKTGSTALARETLLLLADMDGQEYIFVVLGSENRFADMKALIEWTQRAASLRKNE